MVISSFSAEIFEKISLRSSTAEADAAASASVSVQNHLLVPHIHIHAGSSAVPCGDARHPTIVGVLPHIVAAGIAGGIGIAGHPDVVIPLQLAYVHPIQQIVIAGIDARLVADTGILPVINTGIAHKDAGVGQIGAGVTWAPMPCFTAAIEALYEEVCK